MHKEILGKSIGRGLIAAAIVLFAVACEENPGTVARGGAAHILKGNIHIANDCDGKVDSIPAEVIISADLSNGNNVQVPGKSGKVAVKHKAGDANPTKDGDYSITVNWPATGAGDAKEWTNIQITDAHGNPVCKAISCPTTENPKCADIAQKPKTIAIDASGTTTEDLKITCSCGK